MAATKKSPKKMTWDISWKTLFISLSVAANIGLVVLVTAMMTSHVLDFMFMREGLSRYCATENDDKFTDTTDKVKAFREYTCGTGEAKEYFEDGLAKYYEYQGLK